METSEKSINRLVLEAAARQITPLLDEVVFVGGQMTELLVTDPLAVRTRITDDVDMVVRAATRSEYRAVEERLRSLGLRNDTRPGAPICRWLTADGLVLDVMPVEEEVLGFANRWYSLAMETSNEILLADKLVIRGISAPLFLATKWEAFRDRGAGDVFGSHDLADIITITAGRSSIVQEVQTAQEEVRRWLAESAASFLADPLAGYAVEGALPDAFRLPGLVDEVLQRLENIAGKR